jgi:hypothetical protein
MYFTGTVSKRSSEALSAAGRHVHERAESGRNK